MADIEKVIKGLEYCISRSGCWSNDRGEECPWISVCREDSSALKKDALELLKELHRTPVIVCPNCGKRVD